MIADLVQFPVPGGAAPEPYGYDVLILDLDDPRIDAGMMAELAALRQPDTAAIAVSGSGRFADGSIFAEMPNVRAMIGPKTPGDDLVALVAHFARR